MHTDKSARTKPMPCSSLSTEPIYIDIYIDTYIYTRIYTHTYIHMYKDKIALLSPCSATSP